MSICPCCRNLDYDYFEKKIEGCVYSVPIGVRAMTRYVPYICITPRLDELRMFSNEGCGFCTIVLCAADRIEAHDGLKKDTEDGLFLGYKHAGAPLAISIRNPGKPFSLKLYQLYRSVE
jgi:hypothetical protein